MSEAKHTPGPWGTDMVGWEVWTERGSDRICIITAENVGRSEQGANARMIAAAPELLEALEGIVSSLVDQDDEGLIEHAPQIEAARAAIAKAKGKL